MGWTIFSRNIPHGDPQGITYEGLSNLIKDGLEKKKKNGSGVFQQRSHNKLINKGENAFIYELE